MTKNNKFQQWKQKRSTKQIKKNRIQSSDETHFDWFQLAAENNFTTFQMESNWKLPQLGQIQQNKQM
jgi:hypothetical protein